MANRCEPRTAIQDGRLSLGDLEHDIQGWDGEDGRGFKRSAEVFMSNVALAAVPTMAVEGEDESFLIQEAKRARHRGREDR